MSDAIKLKEAIKEYREANQELERRLKKIEEDNLQTRQAEKVQ